MKILMEKRQMVLYMLFGTVTAATNVGVYYLMSKINDNTAVDTAVALFAAIVVAYATNRKMVFHSTHHGMRKVALEFISFMACRLISGMLDIIIMVVFVDFLHHNDMIVKLWSNALVIVMNYAASKWLIFGRE